MNKEFEKLADEEVARLDGGLKNETDEEIERCQRNILRHQIDYRLNFDLSFPLPLCVLDIIYDLMMYYDQERFHAILHESIWFKEDDLKK